MIKGNIVILQPANLNDKQNIYEWLAQWKSLAPNYSLPSWKEFCADYKDFFFDGSKKNVGRCYLIVVDNIPVGQINYHTLYTNYKHTELDIWMKNDDSCGKGYGSDALRTLCEYLFKELGIKEFIIRPSAQNKRAINAYQKAGFREIKCSLKEQISRYSAPDSDDCIAMIKHIAIKE
jgi:diamine N-acetyltransferase